MERIASWADGDAARQLREAALEVERMLRAAPPAAGDTTGGSE
jgi:hypothetical protein